MTFDEAIFCMKQYLPDSDSLECMKCPYYHTIPIEGTENGFTCKADEAHKIAIKALETIPKYKDAYNKGWDDGAKATYEHLKMCEEEQEPCEDCISRKSIKQKLQEHHDFFVNAYGGFSNLPRNDKSRVDEISNCIAMVVNEPPVNPQEPKTDVLDKIRTEIEQIADEEQKHDEKWAIGLRYAVKIIDKYRGSEVQQ